MDAARYSDLDVRLVEDVAPAVTNLKVAIVHDQLYTIGGAEKVLKTICESFPNADVFCLYNALDDDQTAEIIGHKRLTTTFLQKLPALVRFRHFYACLMPLAIEQLDLRGYDAVVSSSYLVAKGVTTNPNQPHLCYMHSPMRYAWDQQHDFVAQLRSRFGLRRLAARLILHYLRRWDSNSINGVDRLLVNSRYVARRVRKAYRRESIVVYPPVDIDSFPLSETAREPDAFVTMSRLVEGKRVDILIEAFRHLPDCTLLVLGDGPMHGRLVSSKPDNVTFMGRVNDQHAAKLIGEASGFLHAAEEDFGIAPVEAQACGTPVIAYGVGGTAETVNDILRHPDAPTGVLFDRRTPEDVAAAVRLFKARRAAFTPKNCRANAERFTASRFRRLFFENFDEILLGDFGPEVGSGRKATSRERFDVAATEPN